MKHLFVMIGVLLLILLAGCSVLQSLPTQEGGDGGLGSTPTLSDVEMQTQIAMMLTAMPTSTLPPQEPTATAPLPTLPADTQAPANTEAAATEIPPTEAAEATATQQPPTATVQPTQGADPTEPSPTATQQPAAPTFTPPANDPRTRLGASTSTDPMDNARAWVWPTGNDTFTSGDFSNGNYLLTANSGVDGWRMANPVGRDFENIYLEATIRTGTCQGSDHYGLILRVPVLREPDQGYLYGFTCDGRYSLRRWDGEAGPKGDMDWLVNWTTSSAISAGSNQLNRLGIFAVGNRLILYANGVLLTEVTDSTFPNGYFGVFVGSDETEDLTIQVDEMSYWENPQP
jgi:hypothetical protein